MRFRRVAPVLAAAGIIAAGTSTPAAHATAKPGNKDLLGQVFSVDVDSQAYLPSGRIGSTVLRWNPCRPITWAVDTKGAPRGFVKEARRAATELAHDAGLVLVYKGTTDVVPSQHGGQLDSGPIDAAGVNLVIAWDHHGTTSLLGTDPAEAGATMRMASGSSNGDTTSPTQYDIAAISFDLAQKAYLVKHDNRGDGLYRALLHELGHAVGLNHVSNPTEIMYAVGTPASALHYTTGDRAGLKRLGFAAGCLS